MKIRRKKPWAVIVITYYVCLFLFKTTLSQQIPLYPGNYQISEHCIVVKGQATTGPEIRVVEGAGFLKSAVPAPHPSDLNVDEIELTGVSIFDGVLAYPDYYLYEWLLYGDVVGTSGFFKDCGSGTIPVFECEKAYPLMTLSDFLSLKILMFSCFPIGLIGTVVMYGWPAIGWFAAAFSKGRKRARAPKNP